MHVRIKVGVIITALLAIIGFFAKDFYSEVKATTERSLSTRQKVEVLEAHQGHIKETVDKIWEEVKK